MDTPQQVTNCFSLVAFKILSLSLTFGILIMLCLAVGLFASILFGTLCFLDLHVYFLHQSGKFSSIIFSNRFPISCSFSSPTGIPMMQMLEYLKLSHRLLALSSFLHILFSTCCYSQLGFFASLCFLIIDLILSFIYSTVVSL